jgi:hypothetical protein
MGRSEDQLIIGDAKDAQDTDVNLVLEILLP